ncbi:NAD(P)-dependent dehydrogenase (short-subunit alcohol dehydrogenase family) [Chitinophaga niastensis]|uniref:NAD(P)-dependent dehydrogenase (Short-subunit alcohol dehydrogenase family) n=1 Tax=Chitinophaga niastensis TaxID=536980 RepID=A0A2P8HJ98_CHINA|nr:SDR family oxidoreductase [Chitinophaga niastensis]PSL46289.1 NAD(P)-dependent dehydrogenase (short-subunit alcohol dehydrogenase family) [Chitinophaga niastensis]
MNDQLKGKKVIVLGGSAGIGFATANAAAEEGADVIIASSNQERIDLALSALPAGAKGFVVDLSNEAEIESFFHREGRFDHLVYTAGEQLLLGELAATAVNDIKKAFTLRYYGALCAVKYGSPNINRNGTITLTTGIASRRPNKGWTTAAGICGAMEGLTRALAVELAPIRVNAVSPGLVRTSLWANMTATDREALYETVGNAIPVGRVGEPEDISAAYLYLMKQEYGTGQVIIADGGNILV